MRVYFSQNGYRDQCSVQRMGIPFPIQLPANVTRKKAEDGPISFLHPQSIFQKKKINGSLFIKTQAKAFKLF